MGAGAARRRGLAVVLLLLLCAACSSPDDENAVELLAYKTIDLAGYVPPSTTSDEAAAITPQHEVQINAPSSGWVRIRLSALGWVSAPGVKQNWSVLVGSQKILRSDMTVIGTTSPAYVSYEIVTDMAGQTAKLEPGEAVTLTWAWSVSAGGSPGTVFFDNSQSTMTVEAVPPPADASTAAGAALAGLSTPENVPSVVGPGGSQTASWSEPPSAGDVLLALYVADADVDSYVVPAGWELAKSIRVGSAGERYSALYWKVAGTDEPVSVTFDAPAAGESALHVWSKRGFSGVPAVEDAAAVSLDAFTTGRDVEAKEAAQPAMYAVTWLAADAATTIARVSNGHEPVFNDSDSAIPMAAAEKTLLVTAVPRTNAAITTPASVGMGLVVFSGL